MSFRKMLALLAASGSIVAACAPRQSPPPAFSDTTGEAASPTPTYPAAPYGFAVGSTIQNFAFYGYPAPQKSTSTLAPIALSDFYNPHGKDPTYAPAAGAPDDRYFPQGSPYGNADQLKPLAILIEIGAVWCVPCNEEARSIMPMKYSLYSACGGEFLLQLADGPQPGLPASPKNLTAWTQTYKVEYPGVIDPSAQLEPLWQGAAYPQHLAIDTTTMTIAAKQVGEAIPSTCTGPALGAACGTDSDCTTCSQNGCVDAAGMSFSCCPDGVTTCQSGTDCAASTCVQTPFWATYESLLDKARTGCKLQ